MNDPILEPSFNGAAPVTDWNKALILVQQALESGFRQASTQQLAAVLFSDKAIESAGFVEMPLESGALTKPASGNFYTLLGPGEYTQTGYPNIVVEDNEIRAAYFDGSKWVKKWNVVIPAGINGQDGQGLLPLFDSSKVGGYMKDAQVRDTDGVAYVSLKDNNTSALSVTANWKSTGVKLNVDGGALSFDKGNKLENALSSYVQGLHGDEILFQDYKWSQGSKSINGVGMQSGYLLRSDNTLGPYSDQGGTFRAWKDIPTELEDGRITRITGGCVVVGGSGAYANIIGKKTDGSMKILLAGVPNPEVVPFKEFDFDVEEFISLSVSFPRSSARPDGDDSEIKFFYKEGGEVELDAVKNAIDPLKTVLKSFVTPYDTNKLVDDQKYSWSQGEININGVGASVNTLLTKDNVAMPYSEPNFKFLTWLNVPTKNERGNILKLDITFLRVGANTVSNLIGTKEDGSIENIIYGSSTATQIETIENLDTSAYKYVSICLFANYSSHLGENSGVTLKRTVGFGIEEDSVLKALGNGGGSSVGMEYINSYLTDDDGGDYGKVINRMIQNMPANGGAIHVGGNHCPILTPVNVTKNLSLIGLGAGDFYGNHSISKFQTSAKTLTMFNVSEVVKFDARNIHFQNTSIEKPVSGTAIRLSGKDSGGLSGIVMGSSITGCTVQGFYDNLYLDNACQWLLQDCNIFQAERYGAYIDCVLHPDAGDWRMIGNDFWGTKSSPRSTIAHVYQKGSGGGKIIGNKFNDAADYGLLGEIYGATVILIAVANSFENMRNYSIHYKNFSAFKHVIIDDNQFAAYKDGVTHIHLDSINLISIKGNILEGNGFANNRAINLRNCNNVEIDSQPNGFGLQNNYYNCNGVTVSVREPATGTNLDI